MSSSSIWLIDRTLPSATTPRYKGSGSDGNMRYSAFSSKLQHYWSLTIRLFNNISRIFDRVGRVNILERCSRCILQPPTRSTDCSSEYSNREEYRGQLYVENCYNNAWSQKYRQKMYRLLTFWKHESFWFSFQTSINGIDVYQSKESRKLTPYLKKSWKEMIHLEHIFYWHWSVSVSLLDGMSKLCRLFNVKTVFLEKQWCYYLTNSCGGWGVHIFH